MSYPLPVFPDTLASSHDTPVIGWLLAVGGSTGRIVLDREVEFARPRDLDLTYTKPFVDLVHELRGHIAEARSAAK